MPERRVDGQNNEAGAHYRGGPFQQWLVEGENKLEVMLKEGTADVNIRRVCHGELDGETVVEANLTDPETRELTFFAENPPKAFYDDAATDDAGLKEALAALKSAVDQRDVETYWNMHEGLRAVAVADGAPEGMMRMMMTVTVEEGVSELMDKLTFTPALDSRIWQIFDENGDAPIVIEIKRDGGTNIMRTGAYWGKINGVWNVVGN